MLLIDRITAKEADTTAAYVDGHEALGDELHQEWYKLLCEQEERIQAAKDRLATFTDEQRDSGIVNADDTWRDNGWNFAIAQYCAEYWELAAESAQSIADFE